MPGAYENARLRSLGMPRSLPALVARLGCRALAGSVVGSAAGSGAESSVGSAAGIAEFVRVAAFGVRFWLIFDIECRKSKSMSARVVGVTYGESIVPCLAVHVWAIAIGETTLADLFRPISAVHSRRN